MSRSNRDQRDAELAAILAAGVRDGRLQAVDALRVIRHELRRRNTNKKHKLPHRSVGAQAVIDDYATRGELPPKNGSEHALHADHVYELSAEDLQTTSTVDDWHEVLVRARTVVVVTASENYTLERLEHAGTRGPEKYSLGGISWAGEAPAFAA